MITNRGMLRRWRGLDLTGLNGSSGGSADFLMPCKSLQRLFVNTEEAGGIKKNSTADCFVRNH